MDEETKNFLNLVGINIDNINEILIPREILLSDKKYEEIKYLKENPYCYLTGEKIDLDKTETYSLDHIIPLSRGGTRSIENMGLTIRCANQAKNSMLVVEFLELCKKVLIYNGYEVVK